VNQVLDTFDGVTDYSQVQIDTKKSDREQCQEMAQQMKGSLLKQVGGAKVAGINFSARTTLEVREWPQGLPDFAHFKDEVWDGKSRDARAKEYVQTKLARYQFPRPFAVSSLPTKDISMQSIANDDGEFRLYQGVWRMQPLPGCAGPGQSAMRLTYAVEISPRAYLPVQLVEGRIVKDLCNNLIAIRECVESYKASQREAATSFETVARA
jgi:ribosome-associated toxin RatA of RatAB toxin-antitoxin module